MRIVNVGTLRGWKMTDPYANKPRQLSEPNEWHTLSFDISVDCPVNWDEVDLRRWAHSVAKYTALAMAESTDFAKETEEVLKTLIKNIKVERIKLFSDDELYNLLDEFDDE